MIWTWYDCEYDDDCDIDEWWLVYVEWYNIVWQLKLIMVQYDERYEIAIIIERYGWSIMISNVEWHMSVRLLWLWKWIWIAMKYVEKCNWYTCWMTWF